MAFDLYSFGQYSCYFRNESYIQLAQAGVYTGPDSIEEYVRFASESSPYLRIWQVLHQTTPEVTSIDQSTSTCHFRTMVDIRLRVSQSFGGASFELASMLTFQFKRDESYIASVHVYFAPLFLQDFFSALATPNGARYVCRTMEESCQSTWVANGYASTAACMTAFSSRPVAEGPLHYVDSDTQGCRLLHAVFASENSDHCAHISLIPRADPSGHVKCHVSSRYAPTAMFSEDDLSRFETYSLERGLRGGVKALEGGAPAQCPDLASGDERCDSSDLVPICPDGKVPADLVLGFLGSPTYFPGCSIRMPTPPYSRVPAVCAARPGLLERIVIPLFLALCFHVTLRRLEPTAACANVHRQMARLNCACRQVSFFFLELVLVGLTHGLETRRDILGIVALAELPLLVICFLNNDTLSNLVYILVIWRVFIPTNQGKPTFVVLAFSRSGLPHRLLVFNSFWLNVHHFCAMTLKLSMTFNVLDPIDPLWTMYYIGTIGLLHLAEGLRMFHFAYSFQLMAFSCLLRIAVAATIFISYFAQDTYSDWRTVMLIDCAWTCTYLLVYFMDLFLLIRKQRAMATSSEVPKVIRNPSTLMDLRDEELEHASQAIVDRLEHAKAWNSPSKTRARAKAVAKARLNAAVHGVMFENAMKKSSELAALPASPATPGVPASPDAASGVGIAERDAAGSTASATSVQVEIVAEPESSKHVDVTFDVPAEEPR